MPGTHLNTWLIFTASYGLDFIMTAILQMKKPGHREVTQLAQSHSASKWSHNLKLGHLFIELVFQILTIKCVAFGPEAWTLLRFYHVISGPTPDLWKQICILTMSVVIYVLHRFVKCDPLEPEKLCSKPLCYTASMILLLMDI